MKLLDVLKKYDRCVMRESAKLTKIYKTLLKESEDAKEVEEATCPDCGNDPCTCESDKDVTENDETVMSAAEFFAEAEKACDEAEKACDEAEKTCDETEKACDETEEVEENDMLRNRPHNGHIDDPAGVIAEGEDEEDFETDESISYNEDGEIELNDDDVIDESTMKKWCLQSLEVR